MKGFIEQIIEFISNSGILGGLIGCLLIVIESILPVLPLFVFITLNFLIFGNLLGFLMSWLFTIIGCILSYFLFRNGLSERYQKFITKRELLDSYTKKFKNISIGNLAVIMAIPFTPAFVVNIAAGLSKMSFKKYIISLLIGKIGLVYFWGFIGTSLIASIKNPYILIKIGIILLLTYIISLIINKVLKV